MDKLESLNVGGYGKDKKLKSFSNSSKNGGYRNILALEDFISSLSDVRTSCSGTDGIARRVNLFYASHRF